MATRAVDNNGDWVFGNGILDYVDGKEEVKQNIITTLRSWRGDCFFDMDAGIDWLNFIGGRDIENDLKRNIITEIMKVPGVINIIKYDAYMDDKRNMFINMYIQTIYGNVEINENV